MKKTVWTFLIAAMLVMAAGPGPARAQTPPAPAPAVTPAPAAAPAAVGAAGCKVGFVNLARVLDESKEGKKMKAQLDAEREKSFAPLKAKQDELEVLEKEISALTQEIIQKSQVWDNYTRLSKQTELQTLQGKYNSILQQLQIEKARIQDDLNAKKGQMLKPLEDKLNAVMEDIGSKGAYCLVLDVSPPTSNLPNFNPIIYRNPGLDITDQVIAALDK